MRYHPNRLATYRTPQGAERYARELRAAWPHRGFIVHPHPTQFGYGISVVSLDTGAHVAWAMRRPRNFGRK